jgi:hypothetical protein
MEEITISKTLTRDKLLIRDQNPLENSTTIQEEQDESISNQLDRYVLLFERLMT